MAPFINLFNNQLQAATVFSNNFSSNNVAVFLRGIRDNPGTYGLDQTAATVAGRFVNNNGLIDIIANPVTVNNQDIRDIGAALGYLFSTQPAAQQNLENGYRPILHVYGRVLRAVGLVVNFPVTMSNIMYDPGTSRFFYGSTIPVWGANRGVRKSQVQADRLRQLRAALGTRNVQLPPLPRRTLRELSMQLANVKVPTAAQANLRNAAENILVLYDRLLRALIASTNGTTPATVTFAADQGPFNTARQNIINAENPAWQQAIMSALTRDQAFKLYLEAMLNRSPSPKFGHCAETFPFIYIIRGVQNRAQAQGLAMVPGKMASLTAQQITAGTASYNTTDTFRYPCRNCTEVLGLAGMNQNTFNTYIRTIVTQFDANVH